MGYSSVKAYLRSEIVGAKRSVGRVMVGPEVMEFRADGTGETKMQLFEAGDQLHDFRWHLDGEKLVIDTRGSAWRAGRLALAEKFAGTWGCCHPSKQISGRKRLADGSQGRHANDPAGGLASRFADRAAEGEVGTMRCCCCERRAAMTDCDCTTGLVCVDCRRCERHCRCPFDYREIVAEDARGGKRACKERAHE